VRGQAGGGDLGELRLLDESAAHELHESSRVRIAELRDGFRELVAKGVDAALGKGEMADPASANGDRTLSC